MRILISFRVLCVFAVSASVAVAGDTVLEPVSARFSQSDVVETPDFQRHVVPLLGKLGCNGRACHGSFQGRGGFRLSLFGYDFESDHGELYGRTDPESPADSLILQKPLMQMEHEGGQRLQADSWQHHILRNWVTADGPARSEDAAKLTKLQLTPAEILFREDGQQIQLQAIAIWSDGTQEDVTDLCRFQSNDDQIAAVTTGGSVTSGVPGDTHVVAFYDNAVVPVPVLRPVTDRTGDDYPHTPTPTKIDHLVVQKLKKLGIVQSDLCTDEEFLRRIHLDVIGSLPTQQEITAFVTDSHPDKRGRKIDELLERPGYAAWWSTKLCDFTGNSDDQLNNVTPVRTAASQQWYQWIHKRVSDNMPYDDLVEGLVMAVSRDPDESYEQYCENISQIYHDNNHNDFADRQYMPHYWSRRNFQANEDRVIGFAYTFLGVRIQCAQCHKHPFDQWTQKDFEGFKGFFTGTSGRNNLPRPDARTTYKKMLTKLDTGDAKGNQLRREFANLLKKGETVPFGEVFTTPPPKIQAGKSQNGKKRRGRQGGRTATTAQLLGHEPIDLTQYQDVRQPLMDWLRSPENPLFAKAFVNRVWASYFNVGIVDPPDDMNLANPPSNAELLDYLAQEFIAHDFDMKWLHKEILNSRTYQLSWVPNGTNQLEERNFARAVPRRLPAEIAWDIVAQAVSNDQTFASFSENMSGRAISLPGAGQRYQQRGNNSNYALSIFGRSIRESNCDCDRSEEPSLLQTIFLRNDQQVLAMLDQKDGWLRQVANEYGLKMTTQATNANDAKTQRIRKARKGQVKRLADLRKQLKAAKGQRNIQKLKTAIGKISRRLKGMDETAAGQPSIPTKAKPFDISAIVAQAYLRTLSRQPNADELEIATTFIKDAQAPMDGLRDLMWVLLNTKEFIVNH